MNIILLFLRRISLLLLLPLPLFVLSEGLFAKGEDIVLHLKRSEADVAGLLKLTGLYDAEHPGVGIYMDILTQDETAKYTLQLKPLKQKQDQGFKVLLRHAREGDRTLKNYQRTRIIDELQFSLKDGKARAKFTGFGRPDTKYIPLDITVPEGTAFGYNKDSGQEALIPDLMSAVDLLLQRQEIAAATGAEPRPDADDMTKEVERMQLENILVHSPKEGGYGVTSAGELVLPAKHFSRRLKSLSQARTFSFPSKRVWSSPEELLILSRRDVPESGYLTQPVFMSGFGNAVAARHSVAVRGDMYFLHIHLLNDDLVIDLRRLGGPYAARDMSPPKDVNDTIRLTIHALGTGKIVVSRGDGSEIVSVGTSQCHGLRWGKLPERINSLDVVYTMNFLSNWRGQLHDSEVIDYDTTNIEDIDFSRLVLPQKALGARPENHITINSRVESYPVSIGFAGSMGVDNLTTQLRVHPTKPAAGITIGPVWMTDTQGEQAPYGFRFRTVSRDSYTVSMFALEDEGIDEGAQSLDALVYGMDPPALATMIVTKSNDKSVSVSVQNQDWVELLKNRIEYTSPQNAFQNRVSLIPLPDHDQNIILPGIGACINVLSTVIDGFASRSDILDVDHMDAMFTPQIRNGVKDGFIFSGAYRSNVPRNYDAITPYRTNWVMRNAVWAGKKLFRTALLPATLWSQHKVAGTAVVSAAAMGAAYYMNPEEATQYYVQTTDMAQNYGQFLYSAMVSQYGNHSSNGSANNSRAAPVSSIPFSSEQVSLEELAAGANGSMASMKPN